MVRRMIVVVAATAGLLGAGLATPGHAAAPPPPEPVVFVHGWNANSGIWNGMVDRFVAGGFPADRLYAWNYDSDQSSVTTAAQFGAFVDDVLAATGATEVDVVSHSLGGLSTRWCIKYGTCATQVDDWVSLGGPNHGTLWASFCFWSPACADMQTGSAFVTQLNQGDETPGDRVSWTTFRSPGPCEIVIVPSESTELAGATNHQTACMDHNALPGDSAVIGAVMAVVVDPDAAVSATLAAEPVSVVAGAPITYRVTVTNDGAVPLTSVVVSGLGPAVCDDPPEVIGVGGAVVIECERSTAIADVGTVTGQATVDTAETDPVVTNAVTTAVTAAPGLGVALEPASATVTAGDELAYDAVVTNTGDVTLHGLALEAAVVTCDAVATPLGVAADTVVGCAFAPTVEDLGRHEITVTVDSDETGPVSASAEVVVLAPPHPFTDIAPPRRWYEDALDWAAAVGLVSGYPSGAYRPSDPVNRAQAVNMLWRLAGSPVGAPPHGFADVPANAWYGPALDWGRDHGLVTGFRDGTFQPKQAVTRGQIVSMVWNLEGRPAAPAPHGFADVGPAIWYGPALDWAASEAVVAGFPDGTFRGRSAVKRSQVVNILFAVARPYS